MIGDRLVLGSSSLLLVVACAAGSAVAAPALPAAKLAVVEADRVRIQAHLKHVLKALEAVDVSHLSPELRAARARNIARLRAYRQRGIFPHNTHKAARTPVFIDRDGRACAVGYLMQATPEGRAAAAEVAKLENLARVPDIRAKKAHAWIAKSGLSVAECTLIQPSYDFRDAGPKPADTGAAADTSAKADKGGVVAPTSDDSGCAVAGSSMAAGPTALLLLLALALRLRRRD
jgi:MYXO-CTERM domain-containing protein